MKKTVKIINRFLGIVVYMYLLSFFSCKNDNKNNVVTYKPENDTLIILKTTLDSIFRHGYYDVWETRDHLGKYRILCEQPGVKQYLSEMLNDSVVFIGKDRLCRLEEPPYYLYIHHFEYFTDSATTRYWVRCIFMEKDTCAIGGMCGGSESFKLKRIKEKWQITESMGMSD